MLVHFSSFSGLLNAPRTMTPLLSNMAVCGGLSLEILPITHYCWFAPQQHKAVLHCQCFQRTVASALFFSFDLALKNAVLIKFSFWHCPPRVALLRRRRKTGASEHDQTLLSGRDARQEGWRGGNHLYPSSFFYTFPFPRTPGGSILSSALHRKQASQVQLSTGLWLRRLPERCLNTGRQETGGTQYWLWWCREQTVCTRSLEQRPAC